MRYLAIYRPETGEEGGMPSPEHMAQMGQLVEESMKDGSLIGTEPLAPRADCAMVRLSGGDVQVSETPQRIAGYALLNAASKAEAIEYAKTFLKVAGDGSCELRQIVDMGPRP